MPWPEPVGVLLAMPGSRASQALRWGLRGLRASLQAALEEAEGEPGCGPLRQLLAELDPLLDGSTPPAGSFLPGDSGPSDSEGRGEAVSAKPNLLPLAQSVAADVRFGMDRSRFPVRQGSNEEIWNDVQRLQLRTSPGLAREWQRRGLDSAEQAGLRPDESLTAVLPLGGDEVLYPGLAGGIPVLGLRTASQALLDPRLGLPVEGELRLLVGTVEACLWFAEKDPHMGHCLKSVHRFGVTSLQGDQRERYTAELLRLWERLRAALAIPLDPTRHALKEQMKARLDLDEAIHSLVYQPPAAADSWWGRMLGQARDTLFHARDLAVQAGCPIHLQLLGGNFADINRLAPDSLQVDFGVPGEVSVCLRLWARIDGEEQKGRVLYRSPQEEA